MISLLFFLFQGNKMSSTPTSPTSPSSPSEFIYRVILSYSPQHDGQIPLTTGDIVSDVKDLGNGWTLGRNVNRDCVGIFPSKCIRPVSDVSAPQDQLPAAAPTTTTPTQQQSSVVPTTPRSKRTVGSSPNKANPPAPPAKPQRTTSVATYNQPRPKKVKLPGGDELACEVPTTSRPAPAGGRPQDHRPPASADPDQVLLEAGDSALVSPDSNATPTSDHQPEPTSDPDLTPSDLDYNSLPTPKRGRYAPSKKPHMVVKPNQGKSNSSGGRMEPILQESSSQDDSDGSPSQSTASNLARLDHYGPPISATKVRTANPPAQLTLNRPPGQAGPGSDKDAEQQHLAYGATRLAILDGGGRQDRSTSPITVNGLAVERTNSQPQSDYCPEEFDRENMANETLQQSPYLHRRAEKYASINKPYYRDYRTMECPADGNYATHLRYKPILKNRHQKVADSKGQHIYYHEEKEKNSSFRLILSILAGLFFGLVMFLWMFYYLEYPFIVAVSICAVLAISLIVLFALSRMCRCMAAILVPSLCTTRGRIAFLVLITGFLLGGPVTNIYRNMSEVSRSMSCSAERSYNQTMLLLKPFDAMMIQLNSTIMHLQQAAHDVHRGLKPLEEGLDLVEMDVYNGRIQLLGTRKVRRTQTWMHSITAKLNG